MLPDQGIGTFESLEAATQKIADLTEQTPDAGTRIAGGSAWLQEVNETIKRNDGETLGSTDKLFGLVGGYEKMGAAGGALGVTRRLPEHRRRGHGRAGQRRHHHQHRRGRRLLSPRLGRPALLGARRRAATPGSTKTASSSPPASRRPAAAGGTATSPTPTPARSRRATSAASTCGRRLSFDYLYLNEDAHSLGGAGPGFDLTIDQRSSERGTGAAIVTFGTQYGHDTWFRPEIFGGYRAGGVRRHRQHGGAASPAGGLPFTLSPGDVNGGWIVAGFSLKAGTPLSYVAIEGEADDQEQRAALRRLPVRPGDVLGAPRRPTLNHRALTRPKGRRG